MQPDHLNCQIIPKIAGIEYQYFPACHIQEDERESRVLSLIEISPNFSISLEARISLYGNVPKLSGLD